jgi:hypothetical protein
MFVWLGIWFPSAPGTHTAIGVMRFIGSLEDYKKQHGTYPDNFEWFGKTELYSDGKRAAGYRTYDENAEFTLSCFGRGAYIGSWRWRLSSSLSTQNEGGLARLPVPHPLGLSTAG